ncbi:dockerin type I domain-containing protein, partial [Vibrio parahaemolyticus]|uniref:dockerin type I domain-containing protein n=1 Tax=Vibrio parahaemolyticus TaxID=670 RepID=UPI0021114967
KDGIGDACQCGDVSGDGRVDGSDVKLLTEFLKPKSKKKLKQPQLCDVASSTKCDKSDLKTITNNVNAAVAASKKKKVLSIKT